MAKVLQVVRQRPSRRWKLQIRAGTASVKFSFMEKLCENNNSSKHIMRSRCRAGPGAQPSRKVHISPSDRCRGSFET